MTTEKLIELAKSCIGINPNNYIRCEDCPYKKCEICQETMLSEVLKRLEKAYTELKDQGYRSTCKYNNICSGDGDADTGCNGSDKWEWEGDKND